jgi:hypothetical protein
MDGDSIFRLWQSNAGPNSIYSAKADYIFEVIINILMS